jgi:hypothetical protein
MSCQRTAAGDTREAPAATDTNRALQGHRLLSLAAVPPNAGLSGSLLPPKSPPDGSRRAIPERRPDAQTRHNRNFQPSAGPSYGRIGALARSVRMSQMRFPDASGPAGPANSLPKVPFEPISAARHRRPEREGDRIPARRGRAIPPFRAESIPGCIWSWLHLSVG